MENKRNVPLAVSIIMAVLCIVVLAFNVVGMMQADSLQSFGYITFVLYSITILMAMVYCLMGFTKAAAKFFTATIGAYIVSDFLSMQYIYTTVYKASVFTILPQVILFGMLCILFVAKDLGKFKSFMVWLIAMVSSLASFVYFLILNGGFTLIDGCQYSSILLSLIIGVMIWAKYADKAARGR